MSKNNSIVALYPSHTDAEAEAAVKELQQSRSDMKKQSIAGHGYHTDEHVVGGVLYLVVPFGGQNDSSFFG